VLVVSAHVGRCAGVGPVEADLAGIGKYLQPAEPLIDRYKYRWTLEDVHIGFNPIEVDFDEDGKP
jgi:hypothetical protein